MKCCVLRKTHESGKRSGVQPCVRGKEMGRKGLCAIRSFDGRPPEANPWLGELFLSTAVGRGDAGRFGLWDSYVGNAGSGCDGRMFIHGRDDMRGDCEEILLTEVNVFK